MGPFVAVLVHGWPVTDYHWRHLSPALESAGGRAITWTPPGLGRAAPESTVFTKRAIAIELGHWLDTRNLRQVVLVGHDWGGTIAWMLTAQRPDLIHRLVIEEEMLPGIDVVVPEPGASHYPGWHGPFNRAVGLVEALVPDREDVYFGTFLTESAGPSGLEPDAVRTYLAAYRSPAALQATAAYYRTRRTDVADVAALRGAARSVPTLAIGGRFAMGPAVTEGLREVGDAARGVTLARSGHYPAEQEPAAFSQAVLDFIG